MPNAAKLQEAFRRRRAAGGPAEQTFATLVGLEMRPRRARDAANLFAALRASLGVDGRDAVWSHPDLLPDGTDLDDPLGYTERRANPLELPPLDEPGPA
jgi:putative hydrolase